MKILTRLTSFVFATIILTSSLLCAEGLPASRQAGDLKVAYVLDSGMVLQRDMDTPVWGWAKPGVTVTVSFGGQKVSARTGTNGKWIARLAPMKANSNSQNLIISDGTNTLTFEDILIGDVWLLSGQSNMETKAYSLASDNDNKETRNPITGPMVKQMLKHCKENVFKDLDEPRLRYLRTPPCTAVAPQDDYNRDMEPYIWGRPKPVKDKWTSARSKDRGGNVMGFSGLGFSFAYELLKKTDVPIGLIDTSKGGTLVSTWMDHEVIYMSCDFGKKKILEALMKVVEWEALMAVRDDEAEFRPFLKKADETRAAYLAFMETQPVLDWLEEHKEYRSVKRFIESVPKFRQKYDTYMKASFEERVKARDAGPRGENIHSRAIKAELKAKKINPPGGQPMVRNEYRIPTDPSPRTPATRGAQQFPGAMYYGNLSPVMPMGIKGVLWFQGENNHFSKDVAAQYHLLQNAMIKSWRKAWGQGDFPFYVVQLPNSPGKIKDANGGTAWNFIQDSQRKVLEIPNTGVAVSCDIGGPLHWRNKYDLGWRMSLIARANLFGEKIECYGPLYKEHKITGDKVLVRFDHVGQGIAAGRKTDVGPATLTKELMDHHKFGSGDLQFFQIAGADKKWHWAKANIVSSDTVEVSSPEVKEPKAVRYMWNSRASLPNFYNSAGLPAAVFRTDDWEFSDGWDRSTVGQEIKELRATLRDKGVLPAYAK